jgi:hypothetical protein
MMMDRSLSNCVDKLNDENAHNGHCILLSPVRDGFDGHNRSIRKSLIRRYTFLMGCELVSEGKKNIVHGPMNSVYHTSRSTC